MKASGRSRRVMRRASHFRSARANASPALNQCRLLALTLPTRTLFLSTTDAATSAVEAPMVRATGPDTGEAHNAPRPDTLGRVGDDLTDAGAFDDDVRLEPDACNGSRVVRRSEGTHEIGLGSRLDPVEDMDFQPALLSDESRKKSDGTRTRHEHRPGFPESPLADREHLFPRFRNHRRRLEQHPENPKCGVDFHDVFGFDRASART